MAGEKLGADGSKVDRVGFRGPCMCVELGAAVMLNGLAKGSSTRGEDELVGVLGGCLVTGVRSDRFILLVLRGGLVRECEVMVSCCVRRGCVWGDSHRGDEFNFLIRLSVILVRLALADCAMGAWAIKRLVFSIVLLGMGLGPLAWVGQDGE